MIKLPLDTKSLYFNIKNDNSSGHTATVATPLNKVNGNSKMADILLLTENEIDVSSKKDLLTILLSNSKSQVLITKLYLFKKFMVNGRKIECEHGFGCYIKEEIDSSKVQFGRKKVHYPSKLIYEDDELSINNKAVYKKISEVVKNYAFVVTSMEYYKETGYLNFDVLIVGENNIPYSKVFINEKGVGNKFTLIFNEIADDYDKEIISLRKYYGDVVNPNNFNDYMRILKRKGIDLLRSYLQTNIEEIFETYPYSLFDFYYFDNGIKKYGILRITTTKHKYFNLSLSQQMFMSENTDDAKVFLISNILRDTNIKTFSYKDLCNLSMNVNSIKYEEE